MATEQGPALDMNKLNAFIGRFVADLGASVHAGMVVIGEKLGLYKALARGPMGASELAQKTGTDQRYLREWLASQAFFHAAVHALLAIAGSRIVLGSAGGRSALSRCGDLRGVHTLSSRQRNTVQHRV